MNLIFSFLIFIEKTEITIPNVDKMDLSNFCMPIFVFWIKKPIFLVKTRCIALTLIPKLIKAFMLF